MCWCCWALPGNSIASGGSLCWQDDWSLHNSVRAGKETIPITQHTSAKSTFGAMDLTQSPMGSAERFIWGLESDLLSQRCVFLVVSGLLWNVVFQRWARLVVAWCWQGQGCGFDPIWATHSKIGLGGRFGSQMILWIDRHEPGGN